MLDKFQKFFGPNATSGNSNGLNGACTGSPFEEAPKVSRSVSLRRRFCGFAAFILLLCAVLPWVFEPEEEYVSRGAKTEIANPSKQPYSQRVSVLPKKVIKREGAKKAEEVARNLSQANPPIAAVKEKTSPSPTVKAPVQQTQTVKKPTESPKATRATAPQTRAEPKVSKPAATGASSEKNAAVKAGATQYYIQVIATSNRVSAVERAARIRKLGLPVYIEKAQRHKSDIWRVRVGRFDSVAKARAALDKLALNSISNGGVMPEKPSKK